MNTLLVLPILLPLVSAALMLVVHRHGRVQRALGVASSAAQLGVAMLLLYVVHTTGIQASALGGWPARFGITLVADTFSALMVLLSGTIAVTTSIYSIDNIDRRRRAYGFYPLTQVLLMGANGAFLTGDLFNLYVWFEVLLIASFVLLVLGNERPQMEGALKYVTLNLISSMLFLTAVGIVYGSVSALNMADVANRLPSIPESMNQTLAMLFLVAFGIKAAVFPLFFWLPDSYHTPPSPVTALFAGLLTKVGVYSLIRVFTLLFPGITAETQNLLLGMASATMVLGVLGAVAQGEVRRILAFHSVSQIGYMVMGFALFTTGALAGAILFILHHGIVKANLFLVAGVIQRRAGSTRLGEVGDLISRQPFLAVLFFITAMSLVGVPPLSGFWAKLALVRSGLELGSAAGYTIIAVSLAVSIFTLISMAKIWTEGFWKPAPEAAGVSAAPGASCPRGRGSDWATFVPIVILTGVTVAIGLAPEPLLVMVGEAGDQLMRRSDYLHAVLGDS